MFRERTLYLFILGSKEWSRHMHSGLRRHDCSVIWEHFRNNRLPLWQHSRRIGERWMHDRWLLLKLPVDMPARQPHYSCSWKVYYKIGCALQPSNVGSWQSCTRPVVRLSNTVSGIYLMLWSDPQQTCLNTAYHPLRPRSHPCTIRVSPERGLNEMKAKSRPDKHL